ncbi:natural killer cell receptor 2B4-like [Carettochelys insculpta]|uniref:natural killer cell receptor 2B4-like n=1 Tax=Carettochelys insculpta TaxID=44489 RepID=UPI003EB7FD2F
MRISMCLLLFSLVWGGGCKEIDVAAVAGESLRLQPVEVPKSWAEINWEVTLDSEETYGIVTLSKGEPHRLGSSPHFTNRVTFHPENLSLQIDPVKVSDSGLYTLQTQLGGGRVDSSTFRVSVLERVWQPSLTVLAAHAELGQCNLTLSCSVPGAAGLTYSWSHGTNHTTSDRDHPLHGNQSVLHVGVNADSGDTFYRCNASNRASWEVDTVEVKSFCDFSAPDLLQIVPWGTGGLVLLLLIVVVLIFVCKHRKKRRSTKGCDVPLTVYQEVEDSCARRNTNGYAQNRIVGNTIYAEVGSTPQAPDLTVYAAVQRPLSVKRQKISPSFISTIYTEVKEVPARPRRPQMPHSSSPSPGHTHS